MNDAELENGAGSGRSAWELVLKEDNECIGVCTQINGSLAPFSLGGSHRDMTHIVSATFTLRLFRPHFFAFVFDRNDR